MTRWLWRIVLAAMALIAIGAQLDRASYRRPELSVLVPGPFRSFAQSPAAMLALAGGNADTARAEAELLVRRRPMPAENLFVLAMAELRSGHPQAFARGFRAASTRGWRFAPLQVTAAQAALTNGDVRGAANRVAALWAADSDDPAVAGLTRTLLNTDGGPEAFAVPLAQTRVWSTSFLNRSPSISSPAAAITTVAAAQRLGARFDCAGLRRFAVAMSARRERLPPSTTPCS